MDGASTQPPNLAITADGQTVYAASQKAGSEALAIIDTPSGTRDGSASLDHTPRALNLSPDGEEVFFTEAGVVALLVLDRATNQIVTQIPNGASPHHPLFTSDGKLGMVVAQGPGVEAGHPLQAAQFFRAVDAGLTALRSTIWPLIRRFHDKYVETTRNRLGHADYDKAWTNRQNHWMEQALSDAIELLDAMRAQVEHQRWRDPSSARHWASPARAHTHTHTHTRTHTGSDFANSKCSAWSPQE